MMICNKNVGIFVLQFMLICILLTSCVRGKIQTYYFADYFGVDTSIYVYGQIDDDTVSGVEDILQRLDNSLSLRPKSLISSEVMKINNHSGTFIQVSKLVTDVLKQALAISQDSLVNGTALFDVSISSVDDVWDFNNNQYDVTLDNKSKIPSHSQILKALELVNYQDIEIVQDYVRIKKNMKVDLSRLSKGYATEIIWKYLKARGVKNAVINIGNNVYIGEENNVWPFVKIMTPYITLQEDEKLRYIGEVSISNCAVVTIGRHQRYIVDEAGNKYHDVLDPRTGYPVDSDVVSVSVISPSPMSANGLGIMLMTMGLKKGMEYVEARDDVEAVFIVENNDKMEIYTSSGIYFYFNENVTRLGYKLIEK